MSWPQPEVVRDLLCELMAIPTVSSMGRVHNGALRSSGRSWNGTKSCPPRSGSRSGGRDRASALRTAG